LALHFYCITPTGLELKIDLKTKHGTISMKGSGLTTSGVFSFTDKGSTNYPVFKDTGIDVGIGASYGDISMQYKSNSGLYAGIGWSNGVGFRFTNKDRALAFDLKLGFHIYGGKE
jgi:hypothetical protein